MKIRQWDYEKLEDRINQEVILNPGVIAAGARGELSAMRIRWDLMMISNRRHGFYFMESLYKYLNDEHIDTALRKITRGKI